MVLRERAGGVSKPLQTWIKNLWHNTTIDDDLLQPIYCFRASLLKHFRELAKNLYGHPVHRHKHQPLPFWPLTKPLDKWQTQFTEYFNMKLNIHMASLQKQNIMYLWITRGSCKSTFRRMTCTSEASFIITIIAEDDTSCYCYSTWNELLDCMIGSFCLKLIAFTQCESWLITYHCQSAHPSLSLSALED